MQWVLVLFLDLYQADCRTDNFALNLFFSDALFAVGFSYNYF